MSDFNETCIAPSKISKSDLYFLIHDLRNIFNIADRTAIINTVRVFPTAIIQDGEFMTYSSVPLDFYQKFWKGCCDVILERK